MIEKLIENMADVLEVGVEELNLETKFKVDAFEWDSLKGYAMLVMMEEEFNVDMPVDDFIEAQTVGDLYEYIKANQ